MVGHLSMKRDEAKRKVEVNNHKSIKKWIKYFVVINDIIGQGTK
jgi:hypothetical protein